MTSHFYGLEIQVDEREFAFSTGMSFRGMTISMHPEGWNIIVRAHDKTGQCFYTMTQHEDISDGIAALMDMHRSARGGRVWRCDKYA